MSTFVSQLGQKINQMDELTNKIKQNLEDLGFEI